jgi:DNA-binding HxlR family transcriptional regulator
MTGTRYSQFCALARAAEVLGERWTLLIVRELLLGPKRFGDLCEHLQGVSPTLLTARLSSLIESGVVRRVALPSPYNAQVYELTEVGRGLAPAIRELIRWGGNFLFPMRADDVFEPDWVLLGLDAIVRRTPTPARKIVLRVRHKTKSASFLVTGGSDGSSITIGDGPGGAAIEARFDTLLRIIATELSLDEAVSAGLASVDGSIQIARVLPQLFDLSERRV